MAGLFGLSVNPKTHKGTFPFDLLYGTFYQQHFREGLAGFAVLRNSDVWTQHRPGLVRPNFEDKLHLLDGTEGIGYCGPSPEPFSRDSAIGKFAICFKGNIANRIKLSEELRKAGHSFETEEDVELIAKLIVLDGDIANGIRRMSEKVKGAFSLLMLTSEGLWVVCDSSGRWPLIVGEKEGAVAVATDSSGFENLGFSDTRVLEPGEITLVKNGVVESRGFLSSSRLQICSFLWVYYFFPGAVLGASSVSEVRRQLGAALARKDIENGFIPDVVCPVPDSGRYHAIGYHQEFVRHMNMGRIRRIPFYDEPLIKYSYAGRSFTPKSEEKRRLEAHLKILQSGDVYTDAYLGQTLVVCDDSIVRGTQIQSNLAPKLKKFGFKEIHFRISNPRLYSHCPWGKATKEGELLLARLPDASDEEIAVHLGVASVRFNSVDDLTRIIGLSREKLCVDCSLPTS